MGHCPEAPCSCKTESRKRNLFPPFVRHDLLCGLWFTNGIHQPRSKAKRKHYDSDSAFQCGNYRNQNNECVSHFIKTSALEAAILQAIKAVSQYVIENEAEFISQLKTVWNESKSKSANNGQQEIDEAKKRMAELDAKIQKLYDSAISGLLPPFCM